MNDPLFSLRALSFAFPGQPPLFDQLDLEINWGDRIVLQGPNGSGKSTLLNLLAGILKPGTGTLLLQGKPPAEQPPEAFRELVFRRQRARDDLLGLIPRHDLEAWRLAWPERFSGAVLQGLGDPLTEELDTLYSKLSHGQQRALALLWLPLLKDKFWLLDEPLAGLDAARQSAFLKLCAEKEDSGLLLVSHSSTFPPGLFNRVLRLENGALSETR